MAEAKKKAKKSKPSGNKKYKITTTDGAVIYRDNLGDYVKGYEAKGYNVEEVK